MRKNLDRRDFLKLMALSPLLSVGVQPLTSSIFQGSEDRGFPNVLILVFDSLSALNVSLYGYPRVTTPNLQRIAERSTVYHSHYSAGNFTTPSTASFLTGTYPWKHRAFSHQTTIERETASKTLFHAFDEKAHTVGFSHNYLVNILLHDVRDSLNEFTLPNDVSIADYNLLEEVLFEDYVVAERAERVYLKKPGELSNSLFLAPLHWVLKTAHTRKLEQEYEQDYPLGLPGYHDMLYPLEGTMDWVKKSIQSWPNPYIAYLHFMPPHDPYLPSGEFALSFYDNWKPPSKPDHFYSEGVAEEEMEERRRRYDQYIAYIDAQLGALFDSLDADGSLDNTWFILTSDHGEMFERGIWQHTTRTLFEPVIRIPLLISAPGQNERRDVYDYTSCIDLLPTLLHLTNQSIPSEVEGEVLPPFSNGNFDSDRPIYIVEAKSNPKFGPITKATLAIRRGPYKLIYYSYEGYDGVAELFDLEADPDELNDLSSSHPSLAADLKRELLSKLEEVNQPYLG
jgi:arylsulfatase A-like enzyme